MSTLLEQFTLSDAEIKKFYGLVIFNQGEDRFNKKAVARVRIGDDAKSKILIEGFIKETPKTTYETLIELIILKGEIKITHSMCSCESKHPCNHAVAALLSARQIIKEAHPPKEMLKHPLESLLHQANDTSSWNYWLKTVQDSIPQAESITEAILPIYILEIITKPISLKIMASRANKSGGFKKFTTFSREKHWSLINEQDQTLISCIQASQKTLDKKTLFPVQHLLSNISGFSHIKDLIQTKRCFIDKDLSKPLTISANRTLNFEWKTDDLGQNILLPVVGNLKNVLILPFNNPWYIDLDNLGCGPLTTTYKAATLQALLEAPKVSLEQTSSFTSSLEKLSNIPLKPPKVIPVQKTIQGVPKPRLRLLGLKDLFSYFLPSLNYSPMIEVGFLYDTIDIPLQHPHEQLHRIINGKHLQIIRNKKEEEILLNRLANTSIKEVKKLYPRYHIKPEYEYFFTFPQSSWTDVKALLETLSKEGWKLSIEKTFPLPWVQEIDEWYVDVDEEPANSWFDIELGVILNGEKVNLIPILQHLLKDEVFSLETIPNIPQDKTYQIPLQDGRIIGIDGSRLQSILSAFAELHNTKGNKLALPRVKAIELHELKHVLGHQASWRSSSNTNALIEKIQSLHKAPEASLPKTLQATLRSYQQTGVNWLQSLREGSFGGILADDMGLGKTLQTLTHLLLEKEQGRMTKPCLILAPTSLMSNWYSEALKFTPLLKVLVLQGSDRKINYDNQKDYDIIISTYPLLVRDQDFFLKNSYYYLILDEAQMIKNSHSKATQIACQISTEHRLCLTGTPMENHLGELWTLFHFLSPGLLGNQQQFNKFFRHPIEKRGLQIQSLKLAKRIAPFMLRRVKEEVALELPPKTEILQTIPLEGEQRDLYEIIRVSMQAKVKQVVEEQGLAKSQIIILDALLKMRQVCCDPRLVKLEAANSIKQSQKLEFLISLLQKLIEEKRKILLFSSFTSMLKLIEEACTKEGIAYVKLTGDTINRGEVIETFQQGNVPLFLISLKAGGTGLNLTIADTVIHYDPWWNPSAERQATDRAHRLGQEKPVFVYKLITEGTIEEKILKLQEKKQALIDNLFGEQKESKLSLSMDDLKELFEPIKG